MDFVRAFTGKTLATVRPGHGANPMAEGFKPGMDGAALRTHEGGYVTWAGTSATVHLRLMFGVASHGFGTEFA